MRSVRKEKLRRRRPRRGLATISNHKPPQLLSNHSKMMRMIGRTCPGPTMEDKRVLRVARASKKRLKTLIRMWPWIPKISAASTIYERASYSVQTLSAVELSTRAAYATMRSITRPSSTLKRIIN